MSERLLVLVAVIAALVVSVLLVAVKLAPMFEHVRGMLG